MLHTMDTGVVCPTWLPIMIGRKRPTYCTWSIGSISATCPCHSYEANCDLFYVVIYVKVGVGTIDFG